MGKLRNIACEVYGIRFDSKREAQRYLILRDMERRGEISELQTQVKYTLIPAQYAVIGGKRRCVERECAYIADFVYKRGGETVVEDAKGYRDPAAATYAKFVIKRKLMLWRYGIRVAEV